MALTRACWPPCSRIFFRGRTSARLRGLDTTTSNAMLRVPDGVPIDAVAANSPAAFFSCWARTANGRSRTSETAASVRFMRAPPTLGSECSHRERRPLPSGAGRLSRHAGSAQVQRKLVHAVEADELLDEGILDRGGRER